MDEILYSSLRESLNMISKSAEEQIKHCNAIGVAPDEIALGFDDIWPVVKSRYHGTDLFFLNLDALDEHFDHMSSDESLWTEEALENSGAWYKARELAKKCLFNFPKN